MDGVHELVPTAHRALRRVDEQESAFAGELVTDGDRVRVRVDVETVADSLWTFADAEHVAGVRDVLRRVDGHDALMPWCTDRVEAFLGRRAAVEQALNSGETVTLVGSLLRGLAEVGTTALQGRWWLTDDLRPLFVPGEGTTCIAASIGIVDRLREMCSDRAMERLLTDIAQMPDDPRAVSRNLDRWEQELTELAAPRPLQRVEPAPARVAEISAHRAMLPEVARQVTAERTARRASEGEGRRRVRPPSRRGGEWVPGFSAVRARARAIWAMLRERARERLPRTARARRRAAPTGRGRMLLAGAGAAGVVLIGGLLWPADEGGASSALERPASSPASHADGGGEPTSRPTAAQEDAEGRTPAPDEVTADTASGRPHGTIEEAAAALLTTIGACAQAGDDACEAAVVDGAAANVMRRIGDDVRDRAPVLIEDYGDVAVVRLAAGRSRGEQMLVLAGQNGEWLVRDVYDVADQPSGQG